MTQDELRALVEQQHQLEELTKHPGWEVLVDYALNGPAGSLARQRAVVNGGARDWEDYVRQCGWLAGAHHILDAHKTVAGMVSTAREQLGDTEREGQ